MPDPKDKQAEQRKARAERLRRRVAGLKDPAAQADAPDESPHDFIERRMRELDGDDGDS